MMGSMPLRLWPLVLPGLNNYFVDGRGRYVAASYLIARHRKTLPNVLLLKLRDLALLNQHIGLPRFCVLNV